MAQRGVAVFVVFFFMPNYLQYAQAAITFNVTSISCTADENSLSIKWGVRPNTKLFNFKVEPPVNKFDQPYPIIGFIVSWFNVKYAAVTDNSADVFKNVINDKSAMIMGKEVQHTLWRVYEEHEDDLQAIKDASEYLSSFEYRAIRPTGDMYQLSKLPFGDEYFFEVRGLLRVKDGDVKVISRNASCLISTEEGIPDKPEKFAVSLQNSVTVRVSWTKPRNTKGTIKSYRIEYQMMGAQKLEEIQMGANAKNVEIKDLEPYRIYHFRMVAINSKHTGVYTPWLKIRLQPRRFFAKLRFPQTWQSKSPGDPPFEPEEDFRKFLQQSLRKMFAATAYKFLGIDIISAGNVTMKHTTMYEINSYIYFDKNGLARADTLLSFMKNAFTTPPLHPARVSAVKNLNFCKIKNLRVCHKQASCSSEHGLFSCKCNEGLIDDGIQQKILPGIKCIDNTGVPMDVTVKAMNPTSVYMAWGMPQSSVGEIKYYDIEVETMVDGQTVANKARAQQGGFFTEYEFRDLPAFGLHSIRIRAVTDQSTGEWTKWVEIRTATAIFSVVFDYTSMEPVTNYQEIRSQVHKEVTESVITALRNSGEMDFRDYVIQNSDIAGQNIIRVTAAIFIGKDWNIGTVLMETRMMEEFKERVQIPGGPIDKTTIKVTDFVECGTPFQDCDGNICKNIPGSFECHCPHGHVDVSDDYSRLPGRKCLLFDAPGSFLVTVLDPKSVRVSFTIPHQLRNKLHKFWFKVQYKRKHREKIRELNVELNDGNFTDEGYIMTQDVNNLTMNSVSLFRAAAANNRGIGRYSTWVEAKIAANIYEAHLNLTAFLYKTAFSNPNSKIMMENAKGIRKFLDKVMGPRMAQYKNSGDVRLIPGVKGRTFAIVLMFFDPSSYVDPKQVSDMFKYNSETDNPYGLDFTSVDLRDFNECNSSWSDCSKDGYCNNTIPGYVCTCIDGYIDQSQSMDLLPGRICISPFAKTTAATTITPTTTSTHAKQTHAPQKMTETTTTTTTTTTITTTTPTPPPAPGVRLNGVAVARTKIRVTWKRYNIHESTNLNDLTYIVQYTVKGLSSWKEVIVPASTPSLTIIDLRPNLVYQLRIAEKWRTNTEQHTEFAYPIEIRINPRIFRFYTQLPSVLVDDLVDSRSIRYREIQDYVTSFARDLFTSTHIRSHYQQIDFGDASHVTFRAHVDQGTEAIFLVFLTPNSAGGVPLLKSAYQDIETKIPNPREMKLMVITDFNECDSPEFDDCDRNAKCENVEGSFHCNCGAGYTDSSERYHLLRGRRCEGTGTTTTTRTTTTTTKTAPTQAQVDHRYQNPNNRGLVYSDRIPQGASTSYPRQMRYPPTSASNGRNSFGFGNSNFRPANTPRTTTIRSTLFTRPISYRPFSYPTHNQPRPTFPPTTPFVRRPFTPSQNFGLLSPGSNVGRDVIPCPRGRSSVSGTCIEVEKYEGEAVVAEVNGKEVTYGDTIPGTLLDPVQMALDQVLRSSGLDGYSGTEVVKFLRQIGTRSGARVHFIVKIAKANSNTPPPGLFRRRKRELFNARGAREKWDSIKKYFMKSLASTEEKGLVKTALAVIQFEFATTRIKFSDFNECRDSDLNTDCHTVRGTCINTKGSYTCSCKRGYVDKNPDLRPGRECVDQCENFVCENGGTCSQAPGRPPRCKCIKKFKGERCEINDTGSNTTLIGVVIGVVAFVVIIMCTTIGLLKVRNKRREAKSSGKKPTQRKEKRKNEDASDGSSSSGEDSEADQEPVKTVKKRAYLQPDTVRQPSAAPQPVKYERPSKASRPSNNVGSVTTTTPQQDDPPPPARPPKPPAYSAIAFNTREISDAPGLPLRRESLSDESTSCSSSRGPTPPLPPKKFFPTYDTNIRHEDLHSRPPPPPPRGNSRLSVGSSRSASDDGQDDDVPPALPPKPRQFT